MNIWDDPKFQKRFEDEIRELRIEVLTRPLDVDRLRALLRLTDDRYENVCAELTQLRAHADELETQVRRLESEVHYFRNWGCKCERCTRDRRWLHEAARAEAHWPPGASVALARNFIVLETIADSGQ